MLIDALVLLFFPAAMAFAASTDLLTMTISNKLSLALVGGFFAVALLTGMGASDVAYQVGAALLVFVVTFGFYACGWIGGGDAKLAAATALWMGWAHLMDYLLCASLLGGALTLLLLEFRKFPLPAMLAKRAWIERLHRLDGDIPYGIALAAAALIVYPDTVWMMAVRS
jgi:prepilin peptidase CpaA